ncbi:hypothetical protein [Neochlamydia sp. AcF95]|uniref:hypothetical protein n=1 Tax=Neochlamydia sp. AcF95 TaxID=2795734 RepID=UPI001BCA5523|nr:hypothetical protein [Neochlamydia sp. AcF95]MBS4170846.1 Uncharacterized protein [Neochlamydia sp. AcF95]
MSISNGLPHWQSTYPSREGNTEVKNTSSSRGTIFIGERGKVDQAVHQLARANKLSVVAAEKHKPFQRSSLPTANPLVKRVYKRTIKSTPSFTAKQKTPPKPNFMSSKEPGLYKGKRISSLGSQEDKNINNIAKSQFSSFSFKRVWAGLQKIGLAFRAALIMASSPLFSFIKSIKAAVLNFFHRQDLPSDLTKSHSFKIKNDERTLEGEGLPTDLAKFNSFSIKNDERTLKDISEMIGGKEVDHQLSDLKFDDLSVGVQLPTQFSLDLPRADNFVINGRNMYPRTEKTAEEVKNCGEKIYEVLGREETLVVGRFFHQSCTVGLLHKFIQKMEKFNNTNEKNNRYAYGQAPGGEFNINVHKGIAHFSYKLTYQIMREEDPETIMAYCGMETRISLPLEELKNLTRLDLESSEGKEQEKVKELAPNLQATIACTKFYATLEEAHEANKIPKKEIKE